MVFRGTIFGLHSIVYPRNTEAKKVQTEPQVVAETIFNQRGLIKIMLATIPPIPKATKAMNPIGDIATISIPPTIKNEQ